MTASLFKKGLSENFFKKVLSKTHALSKRCNRSVINRRNGFNASLFKNGLSENLLRKGFIENPDLSKRCNRGGLKRRHACGSMVWLMP
ncbi:hypothetical protein EQO05_09235 [Methanosarcina sp. MSH10X1]|uniref:hypothetical protein n=1 Tax=Methanosarcina sp. MSH10X1 TaxID=2507075 RepID=UPI000FFBEDA1|nr:hypothetical protein [Methanosarcina sp. MSH10X1]RXA19521.1 hypothetical protein EQO05_09235 [Methanosarcina sp. MSH10X1]